MHDSTSRYGVALRRGVLCAALLATLPGCAGLFVGSAVMGAVATADRRTYGAQTEDAAIVLKGEARLSKMAGESAHVNVNSFNRKLLLTGEVKDASAKANLAREAASIEGVESVVDELAVTFPSSLASRSNDALITGKVKAGLVDMRSISANNVKVVTERGIVYLMGRVTQREGTLAADIARSRGGVNMVVKIFEYMSEEELARSMPAPELGTK